MLEVETEQGSFIEGHYLFIPYLIPLATQKWYTKHFTAWDRSTQKVLSLNLYLWQQKECWAEHHEQWLTTTSPDANFQRRKQPRFVFKETGWQLITEMGGTWQKWQMRDLASPPCPWNWHSTLFLLSSPKCSISPDRVSRWSSCTALQFICSYQCGSFTANVSAAGDISPPEPIFMMRDCPLYKSYEKYVTTSGGFGIGAVHRLQLE